MSKRVPVLIATCLAAGAGTAFAVADAGAAGTVRVTAGKPNELRFALAGSASHGTVTFKVTNRGTVKHNFKIGGKKTKLIAPGKSATLRVRLKKGTFSYLCTVPGHSAAGMKGKLRVR